MEQKFTKASFARSYVVPALLMFAIPAAGYGFAGYAIRSFDQGFHEGLTQALDKDPEVPASRRVEIAAFFAANPASRLCAGGPEARAMLPTNFANEACGDYAQLGWLLSASIGSILLGLFSLVVVLACVGLSFVSRQAQYSSFVAGWHFLRVTSALQVIAQGFIAVMLSFWVTAFFFERYSVKLIAVVGLLALTAVCLLVVAIFKKPDDTLAVEGETLPREKSPDLWLRIEALCARLNTPPPDHIVGGIDDNFFVTEHPVHLSGSVLQGRTLYVSLSLLKRLDKSEADAILAHEMAHFSGGDTLYSKKLSPVLSRYQAYMVAIHAGGLSRPIFYFMLFYWSMFQLALGKSSRERELRADKIAAETTSPQNVAGALFKVAAYSSYRARVESGLFERNRAHSELNIAHSVAVGFTEYAKGPRLSADLDGESFPHPFDSHPLLAVRLAAVGVEVPQQDVADLVVGTSAQTWFAEIGDAERIEQGLWQAYEARFRAAHEESLAYRYLPSTSEERAHVERFFPACEYADKAGGVALRLDCDKLHFAEWEAPVPWSAVAEITADDEAFRGKVLTLRLSQPGSAKLKLPLKKVAADGDEVSAAVGRYYARYMLAKAAQAEASSTAA